MIKTYKVKCDELFVSITVSVDHDILTDAALHEINNFWSGADRRLSECNGNIVTTVLADLLLTIIAMQIGGSWSLEGLVRQFDYQDPQWNGHTEGYPKLDGSCGITLIAIEDVDLNNFWVEVEELAEA